jgi:hypothetical protein
MTFDSRVEALRISDVARGFDHQRSQWLVCYGHHVAALTATFEAGMLVSKDSDGNVVRCDGTKVFGVSRYNKAVSFYAAVVGEYIQLNGVVPSSLAHASLLTAGIRVGQALTGAPYAVTTDYTFNPTNGTVTRVATGAIADGAFVFVNYQYALLPSELNRDGYNFWNFSDDVSIQGDKVSVVESPASAIFVTAYDPTQTYGIGDVLTAGTTAAGLSGLFTKGGAGAVVGTVIQVPTPDDPFLGVSFK